MDLPATQLRKDLTALFSKESHCFLNAEKIEGIKLIEKRNPKEDCFKGYNCFVYIFGLGKEIPFDLETYSFWMPTKGYSEIEIPEKGDLVVYIDTRVEKEPVHIGFSEGKIRVRSKWTYGDIYEHDLEQVPESYGDKVMFFRKNTSKDNKKSKKEKD